MWAGKFLGDLTRDAPPTGLGEGESGESDETRFNVHKAKVGLAGTTRGSPSLVNGVRLRTSSLRGSRVRIPPPAPARRFSFSQSLRVRAEALELPQVYLAKGLGLLSTSQKRGRSPTLTSWELQGLRTQAVSTAVTKRLTPFRDKRLKDDSIGVRRPWGLLAGEPAGPAPGASAGGAGL